MIITVQNHILQYYFPNRDHILIENNNPVKSIMLQYIDIIVAHSKHKLSCRYKAIYINDSFSNRVQYIFSFPC